MSYNQTTPVGQEEEDDIRILAQSFMMYKIGRYREPMFSIVTIPLPVPVPVLFSVYKPLLLP